jgi:2-amino-4-hydroxy-6-hydroxymethyldihydropteridine diphosphokinase
MTFAKPYISIGSNIDPEANLRRAVDLLRTKCEILALSSVYQSPAYGFADQPDFMDVTAQIQTPLAPVEFKTQVLDVIEKLCGRDRASQTNKYGPLALDMDILLWGDTTFDYGTKPWRIPNNGILKFAAVAIPLAEIAPDVVHPVEKVTMREIVGRFEASAQAAVQRLDWRIE